jgi:propanol-preferring alcohol dehydrogenase
MRAMLLDAPGRAVRAADLPVPDVAPGEVLLRVRACGVCRTDLHVVDGDLPSPKLPLVLGHEIVATVERAGGDVDTVREGDRVGVPWLGWACGHCRFCRRGDENLCPQARFTGYQLDGASSIRFRRRCPTSRPDRSCAPGSSATVRSDRRAMPSASASTDSVPPPTW